jgi:hypothetical protein
MARKNPDTTTYIALGVLLFGGGWAYKRMQERKKLKELLAGSQLVASAHGNNVISWTPEEKAAEIIKVTNTIGADEAFAKILARLQPLLPTESFAPVEQTTVAGKVYETTRAGWTYVGEALWGSAKENPALSWDQFLHDLD